jgi:hypothetical protein
MLGTFIDTLIVCTFTALAILSTGVWTSGATGAALTSAAFEAALPGFGGVIIAVSLAILPSPQSSGGPTIPKDRFNTCSEPALSCHSAQSGRLRRLSGRQ